MRKRADALEEYVNLLESMLEKCRREHGGSQDNGESYLQFRPRDAEGIILADEVDVEENDDSRDEDRLFSQELCLPTRNLKVHMHVHLSFRKSDTHIHSSTRAIYFCMGIQRYSALPPNFLYLYQRLVFRLILNPLVLPYLSMVLMTKIIIPILTGHDIYLRPSPLTARSMTSKVYI